MILYMRQAVVIPVCLTFAASLSAQHVHDPKPVSAAGIRTSCTAPTVGPVPDAILQRPVELRSGLGDVHEPVTTSSAEAQEYYDQGLAYLHGYVWIEAARSFHQALRIDPSLAMAHVGVARVAINLKDWASARKHAEAAQAMAEKVSSRERLRIEAQIAQIAAAEKLGDEKLLSAYRSALDAAVAADLDNAEVWLLRGNAEESTATGIGQQGKLTTIGWYDAAHRRSPDHPGPWHYLIHTYENVGQFQKAAEQGARYAALSPAVPHALHMYGHDLMKTGRIVEAIDYFSRADALEQAYYDGQSISAELDWHHGHNLALLGMSHRYVGQMERAESLFRQIHKLRPFFPDYAFMYKMDLIGQLLSVGKSAEVLTITRASKGQNALERAFDAISAGRASVQLGRIGDARAAHARAAAEMPDVAKMFPEWPGFAAFLAGSYADLLDGLIQYQDAATREAGRAKLLAFAATVRAAFTGPDEWIAGLYELEQLATDARRAGDWEFARAMTKHLAEHDPAYPGSLYARALLAEHDGDAAGARELFGAAAQGWKNADAAFAGAKHAREKSRVPTAAME
jgi:tetratricopeptide (TPR) repeat protein